MPKKTVNEAKANESTADRNELNALNAPSTNLSKILQEVDLLAIFHHW